jgi:hypothetical protein
MNDQVYVTMRDSDPWAVSFELLAAMATVPNHDRPGTDLRRRDARTYVVEYANEDPTDPLWRIIRVDTAPYRYGEGS